MIDIGGLSIAKKNNYGDWKPTGKNIGQGGQGQILLVKNKNSDKIFALKRLLNLNRISRFRDEVNASFNLHHPHIVNVIDYDCDNNPPYLVMDYYEKGSLENNDLTDITLGKKLEIFKMICEAVAFAHENLPPIIHRDLKPANIFLNSECKPFVGDFGLCFFDDGERVTLTDEAVGSINYMAPELEEGRNEDISPASDIYSLGKILYWLLTGNMFPREKHRDPKYDLTKIKSSRESHLINEFLDKMIVYEPIDRFEDGNAVLDELNVLIGRLNMGVNSIGSEIPQTCIYCGKGTYKKRVHNKPNDGYGYTQLHNFGLGKPVGSPTWMILVCDYCGNVQVFRPDFIEGDDPWDQK